MRPCDAQSVSETIVLFAERDKTAQCVEGTGALRRRFRETRGLGLPAAEAVPHR